MTVQTLGGVPSFTICDRLRKAREFAGLDQQGLADEIGVSRGTVSTYERDEHAAFKPIVIQAWSMRTGVPLEWIRTGVAPGGPSGPEGRMQAEDKLAALTERKRRRTGGSPTIGVSAVAA